MYYLCQEILKYMIMKKGLLFIVVLFSFVGTWSQVVFKNDEVTVSKLKDKTWVFETWDFTTMYLLEGNDKAALIDAGTRCADLDKIVESITNKPYDVIITHAHPDHAGCIGYFDEVWSIVTIVYLSRNEQ